LLILLLVQGLVTLTFATVAVMLALEDDAAEPVVQVVVRPVAVEPEPVIEPTPIVDSLVDWDQVEADNDCLWDLLQDAGVELTLESVFAFGDWADVQGGPCVVLERRRHAARMEGSGRMPR